MKLSRFGWAVWAMMPVAAMSYHYGPGQKLYRHDRAVDLQQTANALERAANEAQATAYARHLEAVDARRAAGDAPSPENEHRAAEAAAAEAQTFRTASEAWRRLADAYAAMQEAAQDSPPETIRKIRWSRSRALVRAGDIWSGIGELESILDELERSGRRDAPLALATREEIATAYYYAARLMRLSGEPPEEWHVESGRARQHFRYLAETSRARGGDPRVAENFQRNVELVLDLEQSELADIKGKPLPKDSPMGRAGDRPGRGLGKRKQPPQNRDGRGAGGAEDITSGW